jgi:hypothetical protein
MALHAAGVSIDKVVRDTKSRQEAIDTYQGEQRPVRGAVARKVEENLQIQAELETVKARYMERVRRNPDGVAREKATFGNRLDEATGSTEHDGRRGTLCEGVGG